MTQSKACFPPNLLAGRTALVTGAGRGNGRAIADALGRAGAKVVLTDVDGTAAENSAASMRDDGICAWGMALDVTSSEACCVVAAQVEREVGDIGILVNNAGIIIREPSDAPQGDANFRRTIDVNLNGTFHMTMACLPSLKRTRGAIVNIASLTSFIGHTASGYAPSKGAVQQLTRSHALEFGQWGIRVNAVAPGVIITDMTAQTQANTETSKRLLERIPLNRLGEPAEIAAPVVFLVSDLASYVNGATLLVDGGFMTS
ncbi:SDR family NAD(P)-dependent oxidoreductase [Novosphingobium pentaromativorans]|uniref:Putative 3-oxoacyl-(Acyl-carrier-protein) reductase n=1 Tax=Novosphingobium pentaromativorans US6-1 TaxID=1088721 RepID=G6EGF3_9SPHN|nr:glucose 1-dehydrogenase [Novosphingobium pentaromativorans]AIT82122.1 3-oxoacyl-ACP reductase [Novosphingobium pentaromativorans US6-1]EHJ59604.1 putative 3-oxoacyl-(acyl-carrier-protein) reductase [Novosphingobium pentaromativorans US6-1]